MEQNDCMQVYCSQRCMIYISQAKHDNGDEDLTFSEAAIMGESWMTHHAGWLCKLADI